MLLLELLQRVSPTLSKPTKPTNKPTKPLEALDNKTANLIKISTYLALSRGYIYNSLAEAKAAI